MTWIERLTGYLSKHGEEIAARIGIALVILVAALVAARLLARLSDRWMAKAGGERSQTLAPIARSTVQTVTLAIGGLMALDHVGVDVATLIAGAGVAGIAVGFGAQTLVKDLISGFFLIFDGVISTGDHIEIEGKRGTVERVGLRITEVRAFDGGLWYVPNGRFDVVANFNRGWVRAIATVDVAYEQDVARGLEVMQEVGERWAADHEDIVIEPPEAQGVLSLGSSGIALRLCIKLDNTGNVFYGVERDLRAAIKTAFDEADIEIPFPRRVVYHRNDEGALEIRSSAA